MCVRVYPPLDKWCQNTNCTHVKHVQTLFYKILQGWFCKQYPSDWFKPFTNTASNMHKYIQGHISMLCRNANISNCAHMHTHLYVWNTSSSPHSNENAKEALSHNTFYKNRKSVPALTLHFPVQIVIHCSWKHHDIKLMTGITFQPITAQEFTLKVVKHQTMESVAV